MVSGGTDSIINVGACYSTSSPCKSDFLKSRNYVAKASKHPHVFKMNNFKTLYQNMYGLSQDDLDENKDYYSGFDFVCASETWLDVDSSELFLDGFHGIPYHRPDKHINARRGSGGMYVFIRKSVLKGIKILHNHKDLIAWFRLNKSFFGLKDDLYIATCYVAPPDSPHLAINSFGIIQDDISKLPDGSKYILLLDGNAHTNIYNDYISDVPGDDCGLSELIGPGNDNYISLPSSVKKRISCDLRPLDDHGSNVLELCKSCNMFIGNSRLPGNDFKKGSITWISRGNSSHVGVLDYALLSINLYNDVETFNIGNFLPHSDHAPIELSIKCNLNHVTNSVTSVTSWEPHYRYEWSRDKLPKLKNAIKDTQSIKKNTHFKDSMSEMQSVDFVAKKFDTYVSQTCKRVFGIKKCRPKSHSKGARYLDAECKESRLIAIRAGERVQSHSDRLQHRIACKQYKAMKQRKKRNFQSKSFNELEQAFKDNPSNIWDAINRLQPNNSASCEPDGNDFFKFYSDLSKQTNDGDFDQSYEDMAKRFINEFKVCDSNHSLENEILNANFTVEEVELAIDQLKPGKSPGSDYLPSEFIKHLKDELKDDLVHMFNYFIENRQFPKKWAEGIKSSIHKAGDRSNPNNYRGISVPRIFEKIFEQIIMNRLQFLNEAFDKIDQTNGGFLKGRRTSDNIFILKGLIQKQLLLNKKLFICFVDFSKAFDLISRCILFYKLMKGGWHGRVIETFRDLYSKTQFRVKSNGKLSSLIENKLGVNQGGVASGLLFRKYMSDLSSYLKCEFGILVGEEVLTHLLWADDLILISDSLSGIKRQLAGLQKFCKNNQMFINQLKTKLMVFGCRQKYNLYFNNSLIKQVDKYKFLGVIFRATDRISSDPFSLNYDYLCDKARKSLFAIKSKLKHIGYLPPKTMFYIYNTALKPILCYASDVWGVSPKGKAIVDKFYLRLLKQTLGVRHTTANIFVMGETGQILPSVNCDYYVMSFLNRVNNMSNTTIVKQVYNELYSLHNLGFKNWYSDALKLFTNYNLDMIGNQDIFKIVAKLSIEDKFKRQWLNDIHDSVKHPIARTYKCFKFDYICEPYLLKVTNFRHRQSLARLRTSTHALHIEADRHKKQIPNVSERKCDFCNILEDELHFMTTCPLYNEKRNKLFELIGLYPHVVNSFSSIDVFAYIMNLKERCHLIALAEFVDKSFKKRKLTLE